MARPLLLIVIDGFGLAPAGESNAVTSARTPVFDRLYAECPWTAVSASGLDVGLPAGIMGNSEVGHTNIGAGRVVRQDIVRIDEAISSGAFSDNEVLGETLAAATAAAGRLHLVGLYSPGNVHACDAHVRALIDEASRLLPPERVFVHVFADGRDTPPRSADGYVAELAEFARGKATLATVSGRYFAMDRDNRWERTERAWDTVVRGRGRRAADAAAAIAEAYARGESDEFIEPTVLDAAHSLAGGGPLVNDGDAVLFWNYRADRARQLCAALNSSDEAWAAAEAAGGARFDRGGGGGGHRPRGLRMASMTVYDESQGWPALFPPVTVEHAMGDVWAAAGLRQLRIAETEKYAHVTYFFSGGREAVLAGEDRILVPSPKVATYDLKPEMSAPQMTDRLVGLVRDKTFDATVLNLANPDMVGHSGDVAATVRSVEVVDRCVGRLVDAMAARGGVVAITADHGNAEMMADPATGQAHTAHTVNPVPLLLVGAPERTALRPGGRLCDVAPTLLALTGLAAPVAMTGENLATGHNLPLPASGGTQAP